MIKERQAAWDKWIEIRKQFKENYTDSNLISVEGQAGIHVKEKELLYMPGKTILETRDNDTPYPHEISKTYKGQRFFSMVNEGGLAAYQAQEEARDIFLDSDDKAWLERLAEAEQALNFCNEEFEEGNNAS
jgi:hypothetical protein